MVRVTDGSFSSAAHGGAKIFSRAWCPEGAAPPRAVLVWSHGIHEHLGRFERLYARLAEAGVATHAWDHVGHGRSESAGGGKRHQFPSGFDAVVADAVQHARCVRPANGARRRPGGAHHHHFIVVPTLFFPLPKRTTQLCRRAPLDPFPRDPPTLPLRILLTPTKPLPPPVPSHHLSSTTHSSVRAIYPPSVPLFLGGVSFGGLVAATAALRVSATNELRVAGVVLVAPALDLEWTPVLRFQAGIGAFLARIAPNVRGAPAAPPERLSDDAEAVRSYAEDPLVKVANVRFLAAFETLEGFKRVQRRTREMTAPLFVAHGTRDKVCFYDASEAFVRNAASADKTFMSVDDGGHLLLHEEGSRERVMDAIVGFVTTRAMRQGGGIGEARWFAGGGADAQAVVEHVLPRL